MNTLSKSFGSLTNPFMKNGIVELHVVSLLTSNRQLNNFTKFFWSIYTLTSKA